METARPGVDDETRPLTRIPDPAASPRPTTPRPAPREPITEDAPTRLTPSPVDDTGATQPLPRLQGLPRRRSGAVRIQSVQVGSVFKLALAVYGGVLVAMVALGVLLWVVLGVSGVTANFEGFLGDLLGYEEFRFLGVRILQVFVLVGLLWVVLAASVTAGLALVYNRITRFVGGLEVTTEES